MTGNIIDYLEEYGDLSFKQFPFCEADLLVLAQLSYLRFDGLVPGVVRSRGNWGRPGKSRGQKKGRKGSINKTVTLQEIGERMDPDRFFDRWYEGQNRKLWAAVMDSPRFRKVRCALYGSYTSQAEETQFGAVLFFAEGCLPVAAFRGTDDSLVGWKEDFNLSFQHPVPAQDRSVLYLNRAGALLKGPFLVCGHSKGGNLAVYGALWANPQTRRRIRAVYSLDGPGFLPEALPKERDGTIERRIVRIVPEFSLVGMILNHSGPYETVKSRAIGILQHDAFSWEIEGGSFVKAADVDERQKRRNEVLNRWIFGLTAEERKLFVDTLFAIVRKTGADTLTGFAGNWKQNLRACLREIRRTDRETQKQMRRILRELIGLYTGVTAAEGKAGQAEDGKDRISH